MNKALLKRIWIALVLVAVCAMVLTATKVYGVWVIIGAAVFLFVLGLLRKEKTPGRSKEEDGKPSGQEENL